MQINRGIFGRCVEYVSSIVDCDFIFTDIFDISEDLKNAKIHSEHVMLYVGDQMYAQYSIINDNTNNGK